ncbi:hypothetical protein ACWD0G_13070, partial [Streptomyces goshikiensis]
MTGPSPAPGPAGLLGHRPALRPDVLLSAPLLNGPATVHLVKDPVSGASFEIGPKEFFLVSRLDGSRSLAEIGAAYAQAFGRRLGEGNWQQLLALAQFICSFAGSNINVMINDISEDLDTTV